MELIAQSNPVAAARPRPSIDSARCVNCKACLDCCPNQAIEEAFDYCCSKCIKYCLTMEVPCTPTRIAIYRERCDGCGLCVSACPHGAIHY